MTTDRGHEAEDAGGPAAHYALEPLSAEWKTERVLRSSELMLPPYCLCSSTLLSLMLTSFLRYAILLHIWIRNVEM